MIELYPARIVHPMVTLYKVKMLIIKKSKDI